MNYEQKTPSFIILTPDGPIKDNIVPLTIDMMVAHPSLTPHPPHTFPPVKVSYTVMLKGYGRAGDLGAAELMFELMANDRDQKPDVVALNSLLDACVRNGDLRRAVAILEQVSDDSYDTI